MQRGEYTKRQQVEQQECCNTKLHETLPKPTQAFLNPLKEPGDYQGCSEGYRSDRRQIVEDVCNAVRRQEKRYPDHPRAYYPAADKNRGVLLRVVLADEGFNCYIGDHKQASKPERRADYPCIAGGIPVWKQDVRVIFRMDQPSVEIKRTRGGKHPFPWLCRECTRVTEFNTISQRESVFDFSNDALVPVTPEHEGDVLGPDYHFENAVKQEKSDGSKKHRGDKSYGPRIHLPRCLLYFGIDLNYLKGRFSR